MKLGELSPEDFNRLSRTVARANRELVEAKAFVILDKAFDPRYRKREGLVDLFKKETTMSGACGEGPTAAKKEPTFRVIENRMNEIGEMARQLRSNSENIRNRLFGGLEEDSEKPTKEAPEPVALSQRMSSGVELTIKELAATMENLSMIQRELP